MGKRPTSVQSLRRGSEVGRNKPAKYKNRKVIADGHKFDSVREHDRYVDLKLLEGQGKITELELQPKYWLKSGKNDIKIRSDRYPNGRRTSYTADFRYVDDLGITHVEDVKGMDTNVSRLRRAIVEAQSGIRVEIVR